MNLAVVEHVMHGGMELKEAIDGPTAQLLWVSYGLVRHKTPQSKMTTMWVSL